MIIIKKILTFNYAETTMFLKGEVFMKKSKVARFVSIIFVVMLVVGIGCIFFLPSLYDIFKDDSVNGFFEHSMWYRSAFYICYIICLMIVYQLMMVFRCIYRESPFKKRVEKSLKISAVLFMCLFGVVTIKCIFMPTILSFAVLLISFIASLSFYVLSSVIKAAIFYKNENDFTI